MAERLVTDIGGFEAGEVPKEGRPVGVALPRTPANA
jgi:hypothetical protein